MKRFTIFSLTCFLSMGSVFAQQGVTQCGVPTGQPKFPLQAYQELPDLQHLPKKNGRQSRHRKCRGEQLMSATRNISFRL